MQIGDHKISGNSCCLLIFYTQKANPMNRLFFTNVFAARVAIFWLIGILHIRRGLRCRLGLTISRRVCCESLGKFVGGDSSIQWRQVSSLKAFAWLSLNLSWLLGAKIPEGCSLKMLRQWCRRKVCHPYARAFSLF
jgi:hypothetical protein